eukprot:1159036-Pelagomonas_calceolata.AAC.12
MKSPALRKIPAFTTTHNLAMLSAHNLALDFKVSVSLLRRGPHPPFERYHMQRIHQAAII